MSVSVDIEKCTGCFTCSWVCPHGVLGVAEKKAKVLHGADCIECGACSLNCPTEAVVVRKGTGCLLIIIKEDILGMKDKKSCC